ncbi:PEP-CTERM sorting domain-containing protein [Coraliomargarita sp. W4R53]
MKKILTTAVLLTSSALIANAANYTLTLGGAGTDNRHATGIAPFTADVTTAGTFDGAFASTLGFSAGTGFLTVGYANSDDGQVRRGMMKWDLGVLDTAGLTSANDIQSAILTVSVSQFTAEPYSDLWIGQDLSVSSGTNPSAADFNEGFINGFSTGITADNVNKDSETTFSIDITDFVRNDFNNDGGNTHTTVVFYLEDEFSEFADTTAQYKIGASGAVSSTTLTITTVPEPSQLGLGLSAVGAVAYSLIRRRRA